MDVWLQIIMALLPALLKLLTDLLAGLNRRSKLKDAKPLTASQRYTRDKTVAKLRETADALEAME